MSEVAAADAEAGQVSLDDKWGLRAGRILLNGTQAIARVLLDQKALDHHRGLNTAGYISGYRGSPLGNVDATLWSVAARLKEADIFFQPGVNEEAAATAVRGTQQLDSVPGAARDGVFAAWYGKGPGVDRAGDALKHGNIAGAHRTGGVLIFYGDDHGGKSSTVAHHSEQAIAAAMIPSLYPATVGEIREYGLLGYALSRYSGAWVGIKCVNEVVEQTATVEVDLEGFSPVSPAPLALPPEGVHVRNGPFGPLRDEQIVTDFRLPLVHQFVRANNIDRVIFRSPAPRLGLVTAGKAYGDVKSALALLGLDVARASALGVSLYKVGCIWPLEPTGVTEFATSHDTIFVIEEKKSFIELQTAAVLINASQRPLLIGKADESGRPLLSSVLPLEPTEVAVAIADRLEAMGLSDPELRTARDRLVAKLSRVSGANVARQRRAPYFCSGCPHSRSTRVPEGSLSMTGIGCHTMASFVRPKEALLPTHMGGEGENWIGLAPFTNTKHMFQNMGDGTYYHSGLLAIRAAVAAGVNITYKILYNDAVAMTGGQPVDGPISVSAIAQQVRHEGVKEIVVVSDNPELHVRNPDFPRGTQFFHRDELESVQRRLREVAGCTVLIYEQTCAAEKRRRRKRGLYPDPPKRLFISKAICEGCGDCSVQSTCVSLVPVETEFGIKRAIDQSSCNKDYSCLNGFCPSFITVLDAAPRKPDAAHTDAGLFAQLPTPSRVSVANGSYNMLVSGIGGTGVITVAAIIGMAAHIDGLATSLFDMTGLAQKNGAVYSHVRVADSPGELGAQRIGLEETDLLLGFDMVSALGQEAALTFARERTSAVVNTDVTQTVAFQFDREAIIEADSLEAQLGERIRREAIHEVNASALALALLGDSIGANMFIVGVAAQRGLLPVSVSAIDQAIRLNGAAVSFNLQAFRLGRLFVVEPGKVLALVPASEAPSSAATLEAIVARRRAHLSDYQDRAYAARYASLVEQVAEAERRTVPGSDGLARAVAANYAKVLSYKDEYEVARLLTGAALRKELDQAFAGGGRIAFNLAPPLLGGPKLNGRTRKRVFDGAYMLPVLKLLARLKFLRGTRFDPFGGFADRRLERDLIVHYENLIASLVERLTPANHDAAIELAGLVDMVRGFGPVKAAAVEAYRRRVEAAWKTFPGPDQGNERRRAA